MYISMYYTVARMTEVMCLRQEFLELRHQSYSSRCLHASLHHKGFFSARLHADRLELCIAAEWLQANIHMFTCTTHISTGAGYNNLNVHNPTSSPLTSI